MKKFVIPTLLAFALCIVACSKNANVVSPIQTASTESRVIGKIQSSNVIQVPNNAELEGMLSDQFARVLQVNPTSSGETIKIQAKEIISANNKYYLATTVSIPGHQKKVVYTLLAVGPDGQLIATDTTYSCTTTNCSTCEVVIDRGSGSVSCNCRSGSQTCTLKD